MDATSRTVLDALRHADGLTIPELATRARLDLISTAAALRALVDKGEARRKGKAAPIRWEAADPIPQGWGFGRLRRIGSKHAAREFRAALLALLRADDTLRHALRPNDLRKRFGLHPTTACSLLKQARAGR